jgi:hypothetical protein
MVQILLFLAAHCGFLFRPGSFRFVDSRVDESFGGDAMVILESSATRLRFTRDRGQLLLTFQPVAGKPTEWFSLGLLQGLLTGNRGGSEVLDAAWADFLSASLGRLEERLADPQKADELIKGLRLQGRSRAKDLFG